MIDEPKTDFERHTIDARFYADLRVYIAKSAPLLAEADAELLANLRLCADQLLARMTGAL